MYLLRNKLLSLLACFLIAGAFVSSSLPTLAVVPTTNSTSPATGDGVTNTFTFTFELLQASDMTVYVSGILQTFNVAYIVTPTGGSYPCTGGTITFQSTYTPPNIAAILMARKLTLTQTINLPVEGALPSSTLQTVFDRACMQIQQINTNQLLSLQLPITSVGVNTALPAPIAFDIFGWDSTATNVVNYTPQQIVANITAIGSGNVIGPVSSTVGHVALFNNILGTLLSDSGIVSSSLITTSNLPAVIYNNARAYLVTGSPYADGSSSGNATIYVGPLSTGKFQTYDNGSGVLTSAALIETSISISGLTTATSYSLFLYNNAGTWTLETDAWSGINTPLTYVKDAAGRLAKTGATNKLLVAEFYCSSAGLVFNYLAGERSLANIYNKIPMGILGTMSTATWIPTSSSAFNPPNANTTIGQGRVQGFMSSVAPAIDLVYIQSAQLFCNATPSDAAYTEGIGVDSASTLSSLPALLSTAPAASNSKISVFSATGTTRYSSSTITPGFHYFQMLEKGGGGTSVIGVGSNSLTGVLYQ
jgi:hypothetical protein